MRKNVDHFIVDPAAKKIVKSPLEMRMDEEH